jgi:hypothetical protein
MKPEAPPKKSPRATTELDTVLTHEDSFQTIYDNSETFKRKGKGVSPGHSVSTSETEASSITYERPRRRRHKHKSRSSKLMLCGALGEENEIVGDARTSFRQIVTTLKQFGPNEKEAVRDVLWESASAVKATLRKLTGQCGKHDRPTTCT